MAYALTLCAINPVLISVDLVHVLECRMVVLLNEGDWICNHEFFSSQMLVYTRLEDYLIRENLTIGRSCLKFLQNDSLERPQSAFYKVLNIGFYRVIHHPNPTFNDQVLLFQRSVFDKQGICELARLTFRRNKQLHLHNGPHNPCGPSRHSEGSTCYSLRDVGHAIPQDMWRDAAFPIRDSDVTF